MTKFATNASGANWWPNLQIMQVAPLVAKFATNASGAIWWANLQLMQLAQTGGHICNLCKWRHLVGKFPTSASGAMLLLNSIQVTESISGSVVPLVS